MVLKLYVDQISQPCRAVWMFFKKYNISFEEKEMNMMLGAQKTAAYKKLNPIGRVPIIEDGDFMLTESVAIIKYIIQKHNLPEFWYPSDLKARARVEEFLRWYPGDLRQDCLDLFMPLTLIPKLYEKQVDERTVKAARVKVAKQIKLLETYFLKGGKQKYIGGDTVSLADLCGVVELVQLYSCHEHGLYESSPVVKAWVERVRKDIGPYFEESMVKMNSMNKTFYAEWAPKY